MLAPARKQLFLTAAVAILLVAVLVQSLAASRIKSPAWDEMGDIAAGLSYWSTGKFTVNPQHPPLLKELSGLSMLLGGIRWPATPEAERLVAGAANLQWAVGNDIVIRNGKERAMFWARLPFIGLTILTGWILFLWGRRMLGAAAALGALFLFAFDPTVLANSYLVTMDLGFAAFTLLFFFALWSYLEYPTGKRLLLCGLAFGAVFAAKFSALLLAPVVGLVLLVAVWRPAAPAKPVRRGFFDLYSASFQSKIGAGPNDPCPCGSGRKFKRCHGESGQKRGGPGPLAPLARAAIAFALLSAIAVLVVEALYFFPSDPLIYLKGMALVNVDHDPNYRAYLAGTLDRRFYSYFVAAWLLKEPVAVIALVAVGFVLVWRSKEISPLTKVFLFLPPFVLVAAHSVLADNLGIRYILPAMPFGYLIGGIALAELWESGAGWKRVAAVLLGAWVLVAAIGIFPDHLSYFNESACLLTDPSQIGWDGGSRCGTYWLDDSNVDWGEGLGQLRNWADRNAAGRSLKIAYFGSFPAEEYGFAKVEFGDIMANPAPGLYAVSAHMVARAAVYSKYQTGSESWVRRLRPVAYVGHCLYVYDVR